LKTHKNFKKYKALSKDRYPPGDKGVKEIKQLISDTYKERKWNFAKYIQLNKCDWITAEEEEAPV